MAEQQKIPMKDLPEEEKDYQEAAHSTANYADYQPPQKERNPVWGKIGKWLVVLIVVAALAAGGYWAFFKDSGSGNKPSQSQSAQSNQVSNTPTTAKIATDTKHYDSTNFNLGFDYPANWSVTDSGNGRLTARSPAVGLKGADGQQVNAQITMTIRATDQKLPEFDSGNATAAMNSEKIAYAKPTQSQRANTYLSFLTYADTTSGFDGIYITGDNGYKKDQAIPKVDVQKVDPIIGITFAKCANSQCSGGTTALSIGTDNWDDQDFADPIKAMLESLTIT